MRCINFRALFRRSFSLVDFAVEHHHHAEQWLMNVTELTQALVGQPGDFLVQKLSKRVKNERLEISWRVTREFSVGDDLVHGGRSMHDTYT